MFKDTKRETVVTSVLTVAPGDGGLRPGQLAVQNMVSILEVNPFIPDVQMYLPWGSFKFELDFSIWVSLGFLSAFFAIASSMHLLLDFVSLSYIFHYFM